MSANRSRPGAAALDAAFDAKEPREAPGYRRVLWLVLAINAGGFLVEAGAGVLAGSVALQAHALDFLGDAGSYGITLFVLARTLSWRASAALFKGATMALFGLGVLGSTVYGYFFLGVPSAAVMGSVGLFALAANLASALLLFRHRRGDANMRSVWLCTRNDALGNLAVLIAAGLVAATASAWPDLAVAAVMASRAFAAASQVWRQARRELRAAQALAAAE